MRTGGLIGRSATGRFVSRSRARRRRPRLRRADGDVDPVACTWILCRLARALNSESKLLSRSPGAPVTHMDIGSPANRSEPAPARRGCRPPGGGGRAPRDLVLPALVTHVRPWLIVTSVRVFGRPRTRSTRTRGGGVVAARDQDYRGRGEQEDEQAREHERSSRSTLPGAGRWVAGTGALSCTQPAGSRDVAGRGDASRARNGSGAPSDVHGVGARAKLLQARTDPFLRQRGRGRAGG